MSQGSVGFAVQGGSPILYRLSFREAETHRVEVEVQIPTDGKSRIELSMPVWTPGSYLVREYSRQIESMHAYHGVTNAELKLERISKNHWGISCGDAAEVTIRYTLYCREMSVRTNWVERDFAFLTGAATFVTRDDAKNREHILKIDGLPQWKEIATSLVAKSSDRWVRTAKNFDELVDSPIVMGDVDIQSFEIGGAKHYLASIGTDNLWDTKAAIVDVKKIVEKEQAFWGEIPYPQYWFLNLVTEAGGGLEHDNSTVLMTSRWAMRDKSKYQNWLGLVSHEFFHTWNVRRLRPKALMNYDYDGEQHFHELWIAEGITSYYDDLFLARTGLCSPTEYIERLNKTLADVQQANGRKVQSLFDSSFDAWTKYYRPDENAKNSRVSYYTKGSIVGLLLDVEIRNATKNAKSLDDVMRRLWKEHRSNGYTNEDFIRIANDVAGKSLDGWFRSSLESTEELDFSNLLGFYGLEWKPNGGKESKAGEASLPDESKQPSGAYVGLTLNSQPGKAIVGTVSTSSPAASAGFNVGDEILSIKGYRVTPENWTELVGYFPAGELCECLVARHGRVIELKLKLGPKPKDSWSLKRIEKPSDEQELNWKSWLHLPEKEAEKK